MHASSPAIALIVAAALGTLASACRNHEAERRASDRATAAAEDIAQEASLTGATLEDVRLASSEMADQASRANGETIAAFRLEQSDYRGRLRRALDRLDDALGQLPASASPSDARTGELRARRDLLKADLDAVDRSTEPDWATLRTKVERDLDTGRRGAQAQPGSAASSGGPP